MELGALIDDLGCSPFDYEAYPPQSISWLFSSIRSLVPFGRPVGPRVDPVLSTPTELISEANPKVISERTRYLQV